MNTITGAWCTFSGWQPYCIKVYNNEALHGNADWSHEVLGNDSCGLWKLTSLALSTKLITTSATRRCWKQVTLFRPIVSYEGAVQENWAISSDFQDAPLDAMFPRGPALTGGLWDVSDWDVTDWDTSYAPTVRRQWRIAAHQPGYALSLRLQFRTNDSSLDWAGTDYIFESGGAM